MSDKQRVRLIREHLASAFALAVGSSEVVLGQIAQDARDSAAKETALAERGFWYAVAKLADQLGDRRRWPLFRRAA